MIYVFGDYRLDTQTYELHCGDDLCRIETRAFMVLRYLIEHRDRIVPRDELLDNLWPTQSVSVNIINNCIMTVRKAIGDSGTGQETIRTVYGLGYRFVAEVEELNPGTALSDQVAASQPPLFRDGELDTHTPGDISLISSPMATSSPQNVLGDDYLLVTVACGILDPIETQGEDVGREVKQTVSDFFFARAEEVATQYEGGFRFFGPDGFLIIFGWPTLHEDHAQRAVRAGLDLQEDLRNRVPALHTETPTAASVRIGLHTGPMELRNRRDPHDDILLTDSETTTSAIRLQHFAKSGLIVTSPATLALLQDSVEYVEHRSVFLPRQPELTTAYRIVGLSG